MQAGLAAMCAASAAVVPGLIFHTAFMSQFPAIIQAELPAYHLMGTLGSSLLLDLYVAVLFVLIAQTGVGMLQGFLDRVDSWHITRRGKSLSNMGHGTVAVGMVVSSMALSSLGIIALILTGYTFLALSFILVFAVPLMTRGIWLIYARP